MSRGYFITFEGGEGCGKSTQLAMFKDYLNDKNVNFISTREPGGYPLCEKIRDILLYSGLEICPESEFLLFSSARAELVNKVINPALKSGIHVICDRFYDSSIVYQGGARGLGEDNVRSITKFAIGELKPDVTIYLDISPIEAFERKGGADKTDRMESLGLDFHQKVYEKYHELAKEESDRFLVIDATKSREEVFNSIVLGLKEKGVIFNE